MKRGNWLLRSLISTAWHCTTASATVVGAAGEKNTSLLGLTTALLPSARIRSQNRPVFDSPSVIAANRVELSPKKAPSGPGRLAFGPLADCQTIPLPMSAM